MGKQGKEESKAVEESSALDEEEEEEEKEPIPPHELWQMLIDACKRDDADAIRKLVAEEGLVPEYYIDYLRLTRREQKHKSWLQQWDPLRIAVVKNHGEVVKVLLEQGFGEIWLSPERRTVKKTKPKPVVAKKKKGDSKASKPESPVVIHLGKTSPLHWAAFKGHLHILCDLIDYFKTDPNILDESGNTALHLASSGMPSWGTHPQFVKVMEILVSEGSDINKCNRFGNNAIALCTNTAGKNLLVQRSLLTGNSDDTALLSVSKLRADTTALEALCDEVQDSGFETKQLEPLAELVDVAVRSFVQPAVLEKAKKLLQTLETKRELEEAMVTMNQQRPCKKTSDAQSLRESTLRAQKSGVDATALSNAMGLLRTVMAEVKLLQNIDRCARIQCASTMHVIQRDRLQQAMSLGMSLKADPELLKIARLRITKMKAEMTLKECDDFPWNPTPAETEGLVESQIEVLVLTTRVEKLDLALAKGTADGVGADATLVAEATSKLKKLKAKLVAANKAEEQRIEDEETARLMAMKKKKKKGKKGKKKR